MARIGRGLLGAVLALGLLPAGALAVALAPSVSGAKPATAKLGLSLAGVFHVNSRPVTITDRALRVNGVMRPYVRGQLVVVHAFLGHRLIHSERVRVARSVGGTYGHFSVRFASPRPGGLLVTVVHSGNAKLGRIVGYSRLSALAPKAGFGSTGRFVQLIQDRLALLHFYIPRTGVYDSGTGLAIDAYHRLRGWGTIQNLDRATTRGLLDEAGAFRVRYPRDGRHAEGNLSHQLLALVNGSHVFRIYPISSGKPSTPTVLGHFSVYLKDPNYLPDGMYYSNFFIGGYAIHGYDPAPDYPASHGCMRVPIRDAVPIYNWLKIGDTVDVYY